MSYHEPVKPREGADLLRFNEAAYLLDVSTMTIRRLTAAGKLPTVKVSPTGSSRRILRTEIDNYIRDHSERIAPKEGEALATTSHRTSTTLRQMGWDGIDRLKRGRRAKGA